MEQETLALGKKVPQSTIFRIINGISDDPKTATLEPLARFFKVTVADLRHKDLSIEGAKEDQPEIPPYEAAKRKELSEDDKQAAERLRGLWVRYKQLYGASQEDMAECLGVTQGAFGQYINGIVPLNLDIALKMAVCFNVPVSFIKRFDGLERYFDKFGIQEVTDRHTSALINLISSLDPDDRARFRGMAEGYILDIMNKRTAEKDKELSNFKVRHGN